MLTIWPIGFRLIAVVAKHLALITFASRLPADPYLRRDLLGHATVDMSARYSHTSMEERRRAVENLGGAEVVEIRKKA
ncbi:MAG: hypothetical protein AUG51_00150 [Acidobacteria bacterium 13_1_20CM_3_53_8]|nr:MAG: hypothetical protein AUG51_00150 [Acidobacteria bacterium 13_1_20CM_3_53_8]